MFVNDKDYVLDTSNTYFVYKCAQWVCLTETSVCKFNGVQSTCKVKQFRRVSFENGNRRTWFDLYVSESVYNQMHMHILLYYVCHAVSDCFRPIGKSTRTGPIGKNRVMKTSKFWKIESWKPQIGKLVYLIFCFQIP